MLVVSRKYLRQALGRSHLRDTVVGTTTVSLGSPAFALVIMDAFAADLALSGQNPYVNSWLRVLGTDVRVASFNTDSGAYVSQNWNGSGWTGFPSGMEYERHDVLPPIDKDRALDDAVMQLRGRREVTIDTVKDAHVYALPAGVQDVLNAYYFAAPTATLDRDEKRLTRFDLVTTATGVDVRIDPALGASQQIVLDAIVTLTLGSSDAATVNIPDERLVLLAAEAKCWDLMVRKAPRGTADEYRNLRNEAARQYSLLAARFKVPVDRPLRLDAPSGEVF